MYSFSKFLLVVLVVLAVMSKAADAKILDVVSALFDAPNRVDNFAKAPGHFAEKTVEFLAFGDAAAATGYYQS